MLNLPLFILDEEELSAAAASVTLTLSDYTLPAAWTGLHLVIIVSAASEDAVAERNLELRFNGDSAANYHDQNAKGSSSTATSAQANGQTEATVSTIPGSSVHASAMGGPYLLIPDYADATRHKVMLGVGGAAENSVFAVMGRWASTAAITSITLLPSTGNFLSGSRFTLAIVDERYRIQKDVKTDDLETFDFQNIPALDGELVAIGLLRSDRASTVDGALITLNGDTTTSNYARQRVGGTGGSLNAAAGANREICPSGAADNGTASVFSPIAVSISQYAKGDNDPHYVAVSGLHESSVPNSDVYLECGRRNNIEAVTRFGIVPNVGTNYKSGSAMWLYHVPKTNVRRVEATGDVASYTFSDLPAGEALLWNIYGRTDVVAAVEGIDVEFNADTTAANYDRQRLEGDGATAAAAQSAAEQELGEVPADSATANVFGGHIGIVPAFSKTDRHKHSIIIGGPSDDMAEIVSRRWENTAAITSVKFTPATGANFVDGTIIEVWVVPTLASQTVTRKTKTVDTS